MGVCVCVCTCVSRTDKDNYKSLMGKDTHQLVRFEISPQRGNIAITMDHRRQGRLKNCQSKYPPLNMFAHWIIESILSAWNGKTLSIRPWIQGHFIPYPARTIC